MSIWTVAVVALATLTISFALHGDAYCDDDAGNLCGLQPMVTGILVSIPAILAMAFAFDILVTGKAWHIAILFAGQLVLGPLGSVLPMPIPVVVGPLILIAWALPIPGIPIAAFLGWRRAHGSKAEETVDTLPPNPLARPGRSPGTEPAGTTTSMVGMAALTTAIVSALLVTLTVVLTQPD